MTYTNSLALMPTLKRSATVIKPNEGRQFNILGNTLIYKSSGNDPDGWCFFEAIVTGNNRMALHTHPWDEGFYVLAGEMEIQIEDQLVTATRGCFLQIPAGIAHGSHVRSHYAKILNWVSDRRAERFIEELTQLSQPDPERIKAIQQKYQVQFV